MQIKQHLPIALLTVAFLCGCATKENPALTNAHISYDSARNNPQITNLAALELQEASDSLSKADAALGKGENADTVSHLAYVASQKVKIAEETANRKAAEAAVANAAAERDRLRLEARTAEASAAKQEAEAARRDAAALKEAADQQAKRDQALIAQQEKQLRELNAKKTERGMVITLGDVLFSTNKAQVKPAVMHNLQKLADFLNKYPQRNVMIEGHTDSRGSTEHNQELSEQRADAVRTSLVDMGISPDRIKTRGYGESFPVATNATASGRRSNRRVEVIVSDNGGNVTPRAD